MESSSCCSFRAQSVVLVVLFLERLGPLSDCCHLSDRDSKVVPKARMPWCWRRHEHRTAVVVGADRGASCLRSWPVTASRWWWSGSSRSWAWAGTHMCSLPFFFTYKTTSMCHLRDTTKQLNRHEQHVYHSYSFHIIPLESLRVSTHWRSEDYKHEPSLWIFYPNKLSLQYYTSVV